VDLYFRSHIRLHGVILVKRMDGFTFTSRYWVSSLTSLVDGRRIEARRLLILLLLAILNVLHLVVVFVIIIIFGLVVG
jgi:hypothetical protein